MSFGPACTRTAPGQILPLVQDEPAASGAVGGLQAAGCGVGDQTALTPDGDST
ncbi:MAG: hypothetical protein ACRDTD_11590 [Pseudonocardiaceae bacterium]